jgi:hypothetical protein
VSRHPRTKEEEVFDPLETVKLSLAQLREAIGPENTYYFVLNMGRHPHDVVELIRYYVFNSPFKPDVQCFDVDDVNQQPLFV